MENVVNISVYNLATSMASGYIKLGVFTSVDGLSYSEVTASSTRVYLIANTEYYLYTHTSSADITNNLYKVKLYKTSGVAGGFTTLNGFYAGQSDLTEDARYAIEDIDTTNVRYTIKELRRFIKMALNNLQNTSYMRRFKSDFDGIISPKIGNKDKSIILQQTLIEVNKSQLLRAADTNMSFNDGRGSINIKTHDALKSNIKMLIDERDYMISKANLVGLSPTLKIDLGSNI